MTRNEKILTQINDVSQKCDTLKIEILEICKKLDLSQKIEEKEAYRIIIKELMSSRKKLIEEYEKLVNYIKNGN